MPFIRYKNGDVAIQSDKACSCGRGLPLIQDIDGRRMDEIVACDGKSVSGGFFPHLMKEFAEIQKYQIVQQSKYQIRIKIQKTCQWIKICLRKIHRLPDLIHKRPTAIKGT